jgi:conjugative relaxase-like TrwC/TraI family protein
VIRAVIVTLKVLGLRGGGDAVGAAVWRVVDYLRGGTPEAAGSLAEAGLVGYYGEGVARGSAATRVGLRPGRAVSADGLARLLSGRHAVSGAVLVPGRGSAGRARGGHATGSVAGTREWLSLAEAARIVGVSARYLRRLAARTAAAKAAGEPSPGSGESGSTAGDNTDDEPDTTGPDRLTAVRDDRGRWRVSQAELARFIIDRQPPTVVLGFDVTAAAPKSVSVLWAFGDAQVRADIAAAMNAAVDAAVTYLESVAAVGLVGGHNRPGLGLARVSFLHEISRAEEPHLHIHTVLANTVPVPLVDEADGQPVRDSHGIPMLVWRTVDSELIHANIKTASCVAAAVLRHELALRRGWRWAPVRNGVAELAHVPADLLARFSSRRDQIDAELASIVADGSAASPGLHAAVQRSTRAPKRAHADETIRAAQRERLAAAGYTPADIHAMAAPGDHRPAPLTEIDNARIVDELTGLDGLTSRAGTFTRQEVVRQVAAVAADRADAATIDRLASRVLADPRIITVEEITERARRDPEPVLTTASLLDVENRLLALCAAARTSHSGLADQLIDPGHLDSALAAAGTERAGGLAAPSDGWSPEQIESVRTLLGSTDLLRLLVGPAGSGKTETMRLAAAVLQEASRLVVGAAHGGRQTEDLCERLGIPGRVVTGWLTLLEHAEDPCLVWPPGTVLILDEATQVSSRDAARLLHYATITRTVIIALGDPAQLGAIGPGGWFTHLAATRPDAVTLTAVHRQTGPGMDGVRAALAGLRAGAPADVRRALSRLADGGQLRAFVTRADLLAAVVADWRTDRAGITPDHAPNGATCAGAAGAASMARPLTRAELAARPRMMAGDHGTVEWLNRAAQLRRIADGQLDPGRFVEVAGRRFHVGDEVLTLTQAGHTLIPQGRPASAYVRTGTLGIVTALHANPTSPSQQTITVFFPGKGTVSVGWDYLTFAFPDGRDGGLALAYALTAHKAQGSTMNTARPVITDTADPAGLYVMLSRGRTALSAYLTSSAILHAGPSGDDDDRLPVVPAAPPALDRLTGRIIASRAERLTATLDPDLATAIALRQKHSLAELTALHRAAHPATRAAPHLAPGDEGRQPAVSPADAAAERWRSQRKLAETLTGAWAAALHPTRRRGGTRGPAADHATAAIHALLDTGRSLEQISRSLSAIDGGPVRDGLAVLDHRLTRFSASVGIDVDAYNEPPPASARHDWKVTRAQLDQAEAHHLARRPTGELAAELHARRRPEHGQSEVTQADVVGQSAAERRIRLIEAALDIHADAAVVDAAVDPPDYLTDLLGKRDETTAAAWDRAATGIERWRHRNGLTPTQPAAAPHAPAAHRALGPPPADPGIRDRWTELASPDLTADRAEIDSPPFLEAAL